MKQLLDDLLLVVIGEKSNLRSRNLEHLSDNVPNVLFVGPIRIRTDDRTEALVNERLSEVICGKRLSDSELGCAVAHRSARSEVEKILPMLNDIKWILFVEDDADIDAVLLNRIRAELGQIVSTNAMVVNYDYRNQNRPLNYMKKKKPFKSSKQFLAGAVSYAMNRQGLKEISPFSELPIDSVADWPLYFTRLKLLVSNQTWVKETIGPSSIGERFNHTIWRRVLVHVWQLVYLRKLSKLHDVTIRNTIRHLMVMPIIRDVLGRVWLVRTKLSDLGRCRNNHPS
jgi:hypothetical protein